MTRSSPLMPPRRDRARVQVEHFVQPLVPAVAAVLDAAASGLAKLAPCWGFGAYRPGLASAVSVQFGRALWVPGSERLGLVQAGGGQVVVAGHA